MAPARRASPKARKRPKNASTAAHVPSTELAGILDNVKATVLALGASLAEKERTLREKLHVEPTEGAATGLVDVRMLRKWADRTLRTIEVLERGEPGGLQELVAELGEFDEIVHAQDPPPLARP